MTHAFDQAVDERLSGSCARLAAWPALLALSVGILTIAPACRSLAAQAVAKNAQVDANGASQRVKLGLNKSIVIDLPADAYDILVANPAVADAVTRTARRIYLFGKSGRRDQHLRLRPERRADRQPRSRRSSATSPVWRTI